MVRFPVQSSNLADVGWENNVMEVGFKGKNGTLGDVGQYAGVPESEYIGLMSAPSAGKYLAEHIKGRYPYTKVSG